MKKIIIFGALIIVVLSVLFFVLEPKSVGQTLQDVENITDESIKDNADEVPSVPEDTPATVENPPSIGRIAQPEPSLPAGKLKVANFSGKLEKVDVGCFADGECYVVVDGKHITTTMGWSQAVVGSVIGVEGFGDLENYIGSKVEVYAQDKSDGTYTLYGNAGFYVKLLEKVSSAPKAGNCVVGGCSGQLCTDSSNGDMVTTCEYREEYACYKTATCERQSSGQCGWTQTKELNQCLNNA